MLRKKNRAPCSQDRRHLHPQSGGKPLGVKSTTVAIESRLRSARPLHGHDRYDGTYPFRALLFLVLLTDDLFFFHANEDKVFSRSYPSARGIGSREHDAVAHKGLCLLHAPVCIRVPTLAQVVTEC